MKLTTDKIPLPEKTVSVTITASSTVTTAVSHAFYDSNGNLISTVKRQAGTATYNVPVNAKSVRIGIYNGDTESLLANLSCAENGTVWFYTGTSRGVEFNALKKNGITVYPLNAKQYINGSWVAKSAKIYQNGSWVDWITWYYKSGEGSKVGTWTKKLQSSATTNNIQFNNDGIYFVHAQTAHAVLYAFSPLVDLTDIDTLYFKYNYAVGGSSGVAGVSLETFDGSVTSKFVASINLPEATSDTIVSLDVSGLSGKHYIGIRSYAATGKLGTNYCYDVWGE